LNVRSLNILKMGKLFKLLSFILLFTVSSPIAWADDDPDKWLVEIEIEVEEGEEDDPDIYIKEDTVWSGKKILNGKTLNIEEGATLTVKPGTMIVGKRGALIMVRGKLKVEGEKDRKVRFVGEKSEDSNHNTNFYIYTTSSSEIDLEHFILEKGGGNKGIASVPALTIKGKASLKKGIIRRNHIAALKVWNEDVVIEDCEIYENENLAIENKGGGEIMAENNWWGSDDGPTYGNEGERLSGEVNFEPWQKKGPIPIILVPGFGNSLSFKLIREKANDKWWTNPIGAYSPHHLIKSLILAGYEPEENFFWSHYDWRKPCEESYAEYLKKVIDEAKDLTGHYQAHLVAYSLGGLVARSYVQSKDFDDDVDNLITVGSPHLGASEAYLAWSGGELPSGWKPLTVYLWFLQAANKKLSTVDLIREEFPSVQQLLPIYDYIRKAENEKLVDYKDQKERNLFLEKLRWHRKLVKRKTRLTLIAGTGEETLDKIRVEPYLGFKKIKWRDGMPDPYDPPLDSKRGDGRVLTKSATASNQLTDDIVIVEGEHKDLVQLVERTILDRLNVKPSHPLFFETLHHFLLSSVGPADVEISKDGEKMDKNHTEVADSQYIEDGEDDKLVFASLPVSSDEEVKVSFIGKDEGIVKTAFWHAEGGELDKEEREIEIGEGVKVEYDLAYDDSVKVNKVVWSNLLRIIQPIANAGYLNWQYLAPEAALWNSEAEASSFSYELDGELLEGSLDLGSLSLGNHNLKVNSKWRNGDISQEEEKEVNFQVDTSCKSLLVLLERLYDEGKILSWDKRSVVMNLVAEAYQLLSNGDKQKAVLKLKEAKEAISSSKGEFNSEHKDLLLNSIVYLESNPK